MPRGRSRKVGVPPRTRMQSNAEACTRVAMNVGTQVVSNVHGVGSASFVMQNTPVNSFQVAPYFTSPTASSMAYPFSPNINSSSSRLWSMEHASTCVLLYTSISTCTWWDCWHKPFFVCSLSEATFPFVLDKESVWERVLGWPPNDLCIKHQEWREFIPVGSETPQSNFSKIYYHCKPQCVWLRCADFNPLLLDTSAIVEQLSFIHKEFLANQFGIYMQLLNKHREATILCSVQSKSYIGLYAWLHADLVTWEEIWASIYTRVI